MVSEVSAKPLRYILQFVNRWLVLDLPVFDSALVSVADAVVVLT
jgi:hypothetical protein